MKQVSFYLNDNYIIYEDGRVFSRKNNLFIKAHLTSSGYPCVGLFVNGKQKKYVLHRLIGIHFIPNPENKPQINHVDGDKLNFNVNNLEWVTCQENIRHAWATGLNKVSQLHRDLASERARGRKGIKNNKARQVIDTNTNIIYESMWDAADRLSINYNTLKASLRGQIKNKTTLKYYNFAK